MASLFLSTPQYPLSLAKQRRVEVPPGGAASTTTASLHDARWGHDAHPTRGGFGCVRWRKRTFYWTGHARHTPAPIDLARWLLLLLLLLRARKVALWGPEARLRPQ